MNPVLLWNLKDSKNKKFLSLKVTLNIKIGFLRHQHSEQKNSSYVFDYEVAVTKLSFLSNQNI